METTNENALKSPFEVLSAINVNEHTEKKNGLTYLSWAWAWQIVKQNFPHAFYTVYEDDRHLNYHTDGRYAYVKTGVTIGDLEHIEYLPVMDNRNQSIPIDRMTGMDVNKAIQRSLTKACARHGLGLYIYAGEDLPESVDEKPVCSPALFHQLVMAEVEGNKLCRDGSTPRQYFEKHYQGLDKFDKAVSELRNEK